VYYKDSPLKSSPERFSRDPNAPGERRERVIAAHSYRWGSALGLALALFVGACGALTENRTSPAEGPGDQGAESPFAPCEALWVEVRESLASAGARDGEARRQADIARLRCESPLPVPPPSGTNDPLEADFACAEDAHLRDAPPDGDPATLSVYFSCATDIGTEGQPVYRQLRPAPADTAVVAERLRAALLAYLEGPTEQERERGYLSSLTAPFPDALEVVSVEGGRAEVDFAPALEERVGSFASTAGMVFLAELEATVFQFQEISSIVLTVSGDCDRFWRLMESACRELPRREKP
jgi:Sporulation and spore germination